MWPLKASLMCTRHLHGQEQHRPHEPQGRRAKSLPPDPLRIRASADQSAGHTQNPRIPHTDLLASRDGELTTSLGANSFVEEFSSLGKSFLELLLGPSASGGGNLNLLTSFLQTKPQSFFYLLLA